MSGITPRAFDKHDHARCAVDAVAQARSICAERGARLTPVRQRVLELLWESHLPVAAYEMLDRLRSEGLGSQPPVVYRALDFLIGQGFAHKLQKRNAYVGCEHPGESHPVHFLICNACEKVAELHDPRVSTTLRRAARDQGFDLAGAVLEIEGLCPACGPAQVGGR